MTRKQTERSAVTIVTIVLIVTGGILLGLLYYLLQNSEPATLRWWAGITTLLCPGAFVVGLFIGAYGSRREIAGIKTGLGEVVKAAGSIVDLRGQAAAAIRKGANTPIQPQQPTAPQPPSWDVIDEGPDFEVEEFAIGDGGIGSRTIQA